MTAGRQIGAYWDERQLKPHGTDAARERHRYRGEPYCDVCMTRPVKRFYAVKAKGEGWKKTTVKTPKRMAEPYVRPVLRACAACGTRGQVNSKLRIPKEGFLCPDCR